MNLTIKTFLAAATLAATFASCKKDNDPIIVISASSGSTITLEGNTQDLTGSNAGNSVFVDFSTDKQTDILRSSWNLGFYNGSDSKVIINSTTGSSAVQVNKTDINSVSLADIESDTLKLGQGAGSLKVVDNPTESNILNSTVISTISSIDSDNKVYIINSKGGVGALLPTDSIYKIRVLKTNDGYSLQYAKVNATTYSTIAISKNSAYNFTYVSLFTNSIVNVEPLKTDWDIMWSVNTYIATPTLPYVFSDFVTVNNLAGVNTSQCTYANATAADSSFKNFNKDSIAKHTFVNSRIGIGSSWRSTTGTGIYKNIFYIVKDPSGNYYKLKFLTMGVGTDGGTRGKPVIQYELISK